MNIRDKYFLLRPIAAYTTLFIFLLSMSICIGYAGNMVGAYKNPTLNFLFNIINAYAVCLILYGLKLIIGKYRYAFLPLKWIISILASGLLFAELFTTLFYHSLFTVHVIQLVMETNGSESSEFIHSAMSSNACWLSIAITVGAFLLALFISKRLIRLFTGRIRTALKVIAIILVVYSAIREVPNYIGLCQCFAAENTSYLEAKKDQLRLYSTSGRTLFGLAFQKASVAELALLENTVRASKVSQCSHKCPLIVLVIGESYNKYHSHLYNKEYLNTTPNLDRLEQEGNLIAFTDAITPYNMTTHVFKDFFSLLDEQRKGENSNDDWTKHSLFPALFKKAGYNVYFITNQFVASSNDDWDAMGGTFLNKRGLSNLQFTWRNKQKYQYDGDLLKEIPDIAELTKKPTLLIVHLIGQHVNYKERYPKEFCKFHASDSRSRFGGKEDEADYANATLYNDYVMDKIFSLVKNTDAIGLYMSDHGEEVYDWRAAFERTQERPIPKEVMKYQYNIPMMFYLSDTFKANHPDVVNRIVASKDLPVVNTNLSHTLLWLGGIETPEYSSKADVLSPDYDKNRKRILWDSIVYIPSCTSRK